MGTAQILFRGTKEGEVENERVTHLKTRPRVWKSTSQEGRKLATCSGHHVPRQHICAWVSTFFQRYQEWNSKILCSKISVLSHDRSSKCGHMRTAPIPSIIQYHKCKSPLTSLQGLDKTQEPVDKWGSFLLSWNCHFCGRCQPVWALVSEFVKACEATEAGSEDSIIGVRHWELRPASDSLWSGEEWVLSFP